MRRWIPVIALVLVLLAELPLLIPPPFGMTDHLLFWYAGHLTATGGSPYDLGSWITAEREYGSIHIRQFLDEGSPVWVYPAWTVFLFVPFGLLPYPVGPWALYLAYIAVGLFSAILFIRSLPLRWQAGAELGLPLLALFQPFVIANRYGQFDSFLLLGVVLVYLGLERRRTWPLLVGGLLLFTKPQLFLVLAAVVLAMLVARRAWREIAILGVTLTAVAIGTTAIYPESIGEFTRGASARGAGFAQYSTTWGLAHYVAADLWPVVGLGFVGLASLATVAAIRALPAELRIAGVVSGAALLSVVVVPVDLLYDQVPLAAALLLSVAVGRRLHQIAATWVTAAVIPWFVFFIELRIGGPNSQALSGVVPLLIALLLWLSARSGSPLMIASSPAIAKMPAKLK